MTFPGDSGAGQAAGSRYTGRERAPARADFRKEAEVVAAGFGALPSPFGATFSGPAFSEPKLIGFAYAFEQATHHRVPPQ